MRHRRPVTLEEIEARVERIPEAGCWIWLGSLSRNGYGKLGDCQGIHRAVFALFKGPIPAALLICHSCDVKCCVNPAHLFAGTDQDNKNDGMTKGRTIGNKTNH